MSKKQLTYLSLFSGCGGLDIGFIDNNFKCLGAYDIDPCVIDVHNKNLKSPTYVHDLNNLDLPMSKVTNVDVIVAGSPCQGFSTIGKRAINDPRNYLLLTGGKIAIKYKAKVFVCENVLGSNSGEHRKYWNKLIDLLSNNGYETKMVYYNAAEFGVPQTRKRIILYAWRKDIIKDFKLTDSKKENGVKLIDILKVSKNSPNHNLDFIEQGSIEHKIASSIKQGQKLCNVRGGERSVHTWDIPEVFGTTNDIEKEFLFILMKLRRQIRRRDFGDADPVEEKVFTEYFGKKTKTLVLSLIDKGYIKRVGTKHIELTHTFNGKYKRLSLNSLSPTVDTRFGNFKNFLHPIENRSLSVREAARIQGFKDDFIFYGPVKKQYEMIGNAVPPPLSYSIAKNIKENIKANV